MGSFRVIEPGMSSTVQDLGRPGYTALGIPESGAADPLSLRIGNRLAGNADGAAALEMTLTGGTFLFDDPAVVVLAGTNPTATIQTPGQPPRALQPWTATPVNAGDTLRTGPVQRGARAYLCITGGLNVPAVLGSASTLLGSALGGLEGRTLRADDRPHFHATTNSPRAMTDAAAAIVREMLEQRTIRTVAGAQAAEFDGASQRVFWESTYTVTPQSGRTGLRLDGPAIPLPQRPGVQGQMISEAMPCGSIQVPPSGRPIVLLVDHPTTGGYPAMACVATVDLPVLGQLRPRDAIRFQLVSLDEAIALFRERERRLDAELPPG